MKLIKFTVCCCVALVIHLLVAGCATKALRHVTYNDWIKSMNRSALTSDRLSEQTMRYLRMNGLQDKAKHNLWDLIYKLDAGLCPQPDRETLFALAEISYLQGARSRAGSDEGRTAALACARYAYLCLFDADSGPELSKFDPRFRMACEFYNRALASLFNNRREGWEQKIHDQEPIPFMSGTMTMHAATNMIAWPETLDSSLLAYRYSADTLHHQNRSSGLGLPIIGVRSSRKASAEAEALEHEFGPQYSWASVYPATLLIRFSDPICRDGSRVTNIVARLEAYDPIHIREVEIAGHKVPLESDVTTPLAVLIDKASQLNGLKGLYRKLQGDYIAKVRGLYIFRPYQRGKIPIIFVHGLLSSPLSWLNMLNELMADKVITEHYQFCMFFYPTSNPIIISAAELRESLIVAHKWLDPTGSDKALNQMVIVGHSMGGVLTRLMLAKSHGAFFEEYFEISLDEMELTPEEEEEIRWLDYFEPLPFVTRAVFIATPHRGAKGAQTIIGKIGQKVSSFPEYTLKRTEDIRKRMDLPARKAPTGIHNMEFSSPFLKTLETLPPDPRIPFHSIIGNLAGEDIPGGSDGVIEYRSSHLDGATSEKIIQSGHNVQEQDVTIRELRRILLLHLKELGK